jgi:hypothetical protein
MAQSFYGAQPKVVKNKNKYNTASDSALGALDDGNKSAYGPDGATLYDEDGQPLNIMYDKRVFRGNTYNLNLLK